MDNIYIFGDSFCAELVPDKNAWTIKLREKFFVINEAEGGASNHEIFLKFLKYCDLMPDNSIVILSWSDPTRFYLKSGLVRTEFLYNVYWTNFYNETLDNLYQKLYTTEVKRLAKLKNLRLLVIWAFPSGYLTDRTNSNWTNSTSNDALYDYIDEFENEVKPPLIYFSRKEIEYITDQDKISEFFTADKRANHLGNQRVHDALYNIVCDFAENKIAGKINLNNRISNGS